MPWGLAGGLTPETVADAIRTTGAELVDASSGLESAPGIKDAAKIAAFCRASARGIKKGRPVAGPPLEKPAFAEGLEAHARAEATTFESVPSRKKWRYFDLAVDLLGQRELGAAAPSWTASPQPSREVRSV